MLVPTMKIRQKSLCGTKYKINDRSQITLFRAIKMG